jgi:Ni/Fe-hydrogenase subunit HybB-like protein
MMLLPGPRMHPLWFTPWLPFLFLVNCIMIGYAVVTLEASFSAVAFRRQRETSMLASLASVVTWVAMFWVTFRVVEVAVSGKLAFINGLGGLAFLGEVVVLLLGAVILFSPRRRAKASWQARAAILFLLGGSLFRVNTYLVAFSPGANWSYFPSVPELLITFGIIATELLAYLVIVKIFPILGGAPAPARG